jgi:uracil-DNA glycosylase family 4
MTLIPDRGCILCRLHKTANFVCLLGEGPKITDIMIIGEAPGQREDDSGRPFVGRSGKLLEEKLFEQSGLKRSDIYITNSVRCRPPNNRTPSKGEIKACKIWLDREIDHVKPKFVLLLGNAALQSVTGKPGISRRRGRPFEENGIIYVPTFHPAAILRDTAQLLPFFESDLRLFKNIVDRGEVPRERDLKPHLVTSHDTLSRLYRALQGTVSFDIETNGLYPWKSDAKVTMIGFGTRAGEFSIPLNLWSHDDIERMIGDIDERLHDCTVVAHNGKFDFVWMKVHFGVDWYQHFDFDTMLAHYALDENTRHGLKELAQKFCGAPDWDIDKEQKKGANVSPEKLGMYHAHDLHYTRKLRFIFGKMLDREDDSKRIFNRILMPCARLFTEIEYDGMHVDYLKFGDVETYLNQSIDQSKKALKKYGDINWASTKQLADLLYNKLGIDCPQVTPTGNPSVSESTLNQISHPCVAELIKYRGAKQQLSFFIEGWKPFLHRKRINSEWHYFLHSTFKLHGTVTGRLSSEHPNLQQVPRDERIRSLLDAPPSWTLVECDLSQIELRVAAELAGERRMLEAFTNRQDIHWITALREIERGAGQKDLVINTANKISGQQVSYSESFDILLKAGADVAADIHKEWKELRKKAKAVAFGYIYGMGWRKFMMYARDNYGVEVDIHQAQDSRTTFFALYPDLVKWHDKMRRYARSQGFVRSMSGRRRRLPQAMGADDSNERHEAERQAINSPVQSFANDLCLMSMLQLREEFDRDTVRIVAAVHDAALFYVKNKDVERVTERMLQIMSHPKLLDDFKIDIKVPIEAEAKIGPWGVGVSFDKWRKQWNQHQTSKKRAAHSLSTSISSRADNQMIHS